MRAAPAPADALARDEGRLLRALGQIGAEFGTDRSDICAARLIELWVWLVGESAARELLTRGRMPDLSPARTLLMLDGPTSDWAAELTGEAIDGQEDELLTLLGDSLAVQLEPLIATLNTLSRRPRRALWRSATDRLAGVFLYVGEDVGEPERGRELARRAVSAPPLLGRARTGLVRLPDGREQRLQIRDGCCLYYRVPGGERCASCPLVGDDERGERLAAELAG